MMTTSPKSQSSPRRVHFIDGLRGIAIIAVALFHAFVRWPTFYSYGYKFVGNPIFDTKIAGVNLFFMISGFVILMTLRKCKSFFDFIFRRWRRLFPAMLTCSVIILGTAALLPERPEGAINLWDLLPGLTFIGDGPGTKHLWDLFSKYWNINIHSIDGSFWSLYVEVKFYIIFGAAYFLFGEYVGIPVIFVLFLLSKLSSDKLLNVHFGPSDIGGHFFASLHQFLTIAGIHWLSDFLSLSSYGFFAAGSLLFLSDETKNRRLFWLGVLVVMLATLSNSESPRIANMCLTLLFPITMASSSVRYLIANKVLVFIGYISYPLYLLHQNLMVAMTVKIGRAFPAMPDLLMPVLPICVVGFLAWIVTWYFEPAIKTFLDRFLRARTSRVSEVP
jgi:peptidoglycan/LPS O-acetylase OafA/YrhL